MARDDFDEVRNQTSTILAALNCLPIWILRDGAKDVPEDNSRALVRERRLDVTSMAVLDAFAAICVHRPFDAYAVTYEVKDSKVVLYVASSSTDGVPAEVQSHIESVWNTMKNLAAHPDSRHVQETNTITPALNPAHSDFIALFYQFSWPALSHRFSSVADTAIQQLDRVLNDNVDKGPLVDCSIELSEHERTLCSEIRSALAKARQSVLVDGLGTNHWGIHADLCDLRVLLKGRDAVDRLKRLDRLTATALSQDIRSLVWLGVPIDTLRTFAHSQSYAEMCKLDFDIVSLKPVTFTCCVDVDSSDLSQFARWAYTDVNMRSPEPNFEAEFTAHILDPLKARYRAGARDLAEDAPEPVPAHAECALLAHFAGVPEDDAWTPPYISYIGTSEPCCLPCYRYIDVVNNGYPARKMHVRGTDGRVPRTWVACDVSLYGLFPDSRPVSYTFADLRNDYRNILVVLRQHLARVRQAGRLSRGEPPLTPEEQQYRDAVIRRASIEPYYARMQLTGDYA